MDSEDLHTCDNCSQVTLYTLHFIFVDDEELHLCDDCSVKNDTGMRDYKEIIRARVQRDPAFREALLKETKDFISDLLKKEGY